MEKEIECHDGYAKEPSTADVMLPDYGFDNSSAHVDKNTSAITDKTFGLPDIPETLKDQSNSSFTTTVEDVLPPKFFENKLEEFEIIGQSLHTEINEKAPPTPKQDDTYKNVIEMEKEEKDDSKNSIKELITRETDQIDGLKYNSQSGTTIANDSEEDQEKDNSASHDNFESDRDTTEDYIDCSTILKSDDLQEDAQTESKDSNLSNKEKKSDEKSAIKESNVSEETKNKFSIDESTDVVQLHPQNKTFFTALEKELDLSAIEAEPELLCINSPNENMEENVQEMIRDSENRNHVKLAKVEEQCLPASNIEEIKEDVLFKTENQKTSHPDEKFAKQHEHKQSTEDRNTNLHKPDNSFTETQAEQQYKTNYQVMAHQVSIKMKMWSHM